VVCPPRIPPQRTLQWSVLRFLGTPKTLLAPTALCPCRWSFFRWDFFSPFSPCLSFTKVPFCPSPSFLKGSWCDMWWFCTPRSLFWNSSEPSIPRDWQGPLGEGSFPFFLTSAPSYRPQQMPGEIHFLPPTPGVLVVWVLGCSHSIPPFSRYPTFLGVRGYTNLGGYGPIAPARRGPPPNFLTLPPLCFSVFSPPPNLLVFMCAPKIKLWDTVFPISRLGVVFWCFVVLLTFFQPPPLLPVVVFVLEDNPSRSATPPFFFAIQSASVFSDRSTHYVPFPGGQVEIFCQGLLWASRRFLLKRLPAPFFYLPGLPSPFGPLDF